MCELRGRAPTVDRVTPRGPALACSSPVTLRHPVRTAYRCFLPDLAGFTGHCRAGPGYQRCPVQTWPNGAGPRVGVQPRCSGLRVQGTASSPSSTATDPYYRRGRSVSATWRSIAPEQGALGSVEFPQHELLLDGRRPSTSDAERIDIPQSDVGTRVRGKVATSDSLCTPQPSGRVALIPNERRY